MKKKRCLSRKKKLLTFFLLPYKLRTWALYCCCSRFLIYIVALLKHTYTHNGSSHTYKCLQNKIEFLLFASLFYSSFSYFSPQNFRYSLSLVPLLHLFHHTTITQLYISLSLYHSIEKSLEKYTFEGNFFE